MIRLFTYEGYKVTIAEEALTLAPFKKIWQRDKSKTKDNALTELSYVYFMCDPRSDYQYIVDEEERSVEVIKGEGLPEGWKPDKTVKEAMEFYSSFKPMSSLLLEDTRVAVDKLRAMLKTIDLSAVDDKGRPIYTLNTITSTIKQIPQLVKDLNEAEHALAKDIANEGKARGAIEKTIMDDDLDI